MAKARRGRKRNPGQHPPAVGTGSTSREHWRSDGRPKARFASQDEVNRESLRLRLEQGADLDSYRCGFCQGWHLGNRRE